MCYRGSESDVTHPLTAYLCIGYFNSTAVAYYALVSVGLELTAIALPFLGCTEDPLTEEAVPLRAERTVVDCLWLLNFAIRPCKNLLR